MTNLLLIILVALPIVITYFLKSNAALAYLALCVGFVLLSLSTNDIQKLLDNTDLLSISTDSLGLFLLVAPPLLTLLLTQKSIHGQNKVLVELIPAACLGGLLALIATPLLSESVRSNLTGGSLWEELQKIQGWLIGLGALSSLVLVWTKH